jgi:hypothetical protein
MNKRMQWWTPDRESWFLNHPDATFLEYRNDYPDDDYSFDAWRHKRASILPHTRSKALREPLDGMGLYRRPNTPLDMPAIFHNKNEIDFHWSDVIDPLEDMQAIAKNSSGSQDRAIIRVETKRTLPVLFISDWHVGSWGVSYRTLAAVTKIIQQRKLYVAAIGDMLQMAIRLRGVLEVSDNALVPRLQDRFWESWMEDMAGYILWGTWDNHTVMRQEDATGFSAYAETFRNKTIYHSGIGHVDLIIGGETYKIATSHRFRGNSYLNPTHGQMRYGRMEGQDREVIVAGDSHVPASQFYADGETPKAAINCGTLQTDSGYSKRFYSLSTHDWMPVVEFWPDRHLFLPYPSLTHWLEKNPASEADNEAVAVDGPISERNSDEAFDPSRSAPDFPAGGNS